MGQVFPHSVIGPNIQAQSTPKGLKVSPGTSPVTKILIPSCKICPFNWPVRIYIFPDQPILQLGQKIRAGAALGPQREAKSSQTRSAMGLGLAQPTPARAGVVRSLKHSNQWIFRAEEERVILGCSLGGS